MWTYFDLGSGTYVRTDRQIGAADEFMIPEAEWEEMDAWCSAIFSAGYPATEVSEEEALAAVARQRAEIRLNDSGPGA